MKLVINKIIAKIVNPLFPYFGTCGKCGRNWGWTKHSTRPTSDSEGLFLFCLDCDKIVTVQERWEALDKWKQNSIAQFVILGQERVEMDIEKEIEKIKNTELAEFPREK